jgi:predicted N-formylglutamate amidohydrolase
MSRQLIITCEHAGNEVPEEYRHLFEQKAEMLNTHRGIDIGALELTNAIAEKMEQEPYLHTVTRLLVDLNRSVQSPTLFSEFTKDQPQKIREQIFKKYYQPYRKRVEDKIKEVIDQGEQVIHLGVHTFTPVWNGKERAVDVGFLYDPTREREQSFCRQWRKSLAERFPKICLRMNEPYRGTMDGFTTYLRRQYPPEAYVGFELEVSQRFTDSSLKKEWAKLQEDIADSFRYTFEETAKY